MRTLERVLRTFLVTGIAFCPLSLEAQDAPQRQGLWFNLGVGSGSLGCDGCDTRVNGLSGQFSVGGTRSDRWLIGVGTNGWTKSESGATLTMSALTALVRFYPSPTGRFYLTGGVGFARLDLGVAQGYSDSANGTAALLGLGYDIRLAPSVSLTPFWNGVAGSFDGGGANFGQIGLSFTHH